MKEELRELYKEYKSLLYKVREWDSPTIDGFIRWLITNEL